jgi:diguanylate cyclase (GGDEF)-like protein
MSATVPRELAPETPGRALSRGRVGVRAYARFRVLLDRTVWPSDRPVAELRWGAVALFLILALAIPAMAIADPSGRYGQAVIVSGLALAIIGPLAWSRWAGMAMARTVLPRAIGPIVVLVALASAGNFDPITMEPPVGRPFIIIAIMYAALTPGFGIAAAIVALASLGLLIDHRSVTGSLADPATVDFLVRVLVTYFGAFAMNAVDHGLRREQRRAERLAARKVARADQLEDLQRIVSRFDGSRPVAEVMQAVVDDVAAGFGITLVSAYLPDDSGRLAMVGVAGYDSPFHVIEPGVGIIGRAAASRRTIYSADVLSDPDYRSARDDVRSEVAVPVLHGDELLGIVNFEGNEAEPIGPAHVAVAEMLARWIASALRSGRLDEERRQRLHAIERVLEISRGLVADPDRTRIAAAVVDAARDLLAADVVEFAGRQLDGTFRIEQLVGSSEDRLGSTVIVGEGADGQVAATSASLLWTDPHGGGTTLGFGIRLDGRPAAILTVSRRRPDRPFSDVDRAIGDLLVTHIEVALHNAAVYALATEAAVRDPLTGLLNRRFFDEAVETAFATSVRGGTELSLVVLDLDRFSEVNNVHGHPVGDAVLRRVAKAMSGAVRTGDIVARYGGEEFVIIAPGSDRDGAVRLAERIRAAVAAETVRPVDGLDVPITISAGVASRLGDEADARALFRAADSALLAAKRAGRDRVVSL